MGSFLFMIICNILLVTAALARPQNVEIEKQVIIKIPFEDLILERYPQLLPIMAKIGRNEMKQLKVKTGLFETNNFFSPIREKMSQIKLISFNKDMLNFLPHLPLSRLVPSPDFQKYDSPKTNSQSENLKLSNRMPVYSENYQKYPNTYDDRFAPRKVTKSMYSKKYTDLHSKQNYLRGDPINTGARKIKFEVNNEKANSLNNNSKSQRILQPFNTMHSDRQPQEVSASVISTEIKKSVKMNTLAKNNHFKLNLVPGDIKVMSPFPEKIQRNPKINNERFKTLNSGRSGKALISPESVMTGTRFNKKSETNDGISENLPEKNFGIHIRQNKTNLRTQGENRMSNVFNVDKTLDIDPDNMHALPEVTNNYARDPIKLTVPGKLLHRLKIIRGGVAIVGPRGIATASDGGTAIVGPDGVAYTKPNAIAIVGPGSRVVALPVDLDFNRLINQLSRRSASQQVNVKNGLSGEYVLNNDGQNIRELFLPTGGKIVATGPIVYHDRPQPNVETFLV